MKFLSEEHFIDFYSIQVFLGTPLFIGQNPVDFVLLVFFFPRSNRWLDHLNHLQLDIEADEDGHSTDCINTQGKVQDVKMSQCFRIFQNPQLMSVSDSLLQLLNWKSRDWPISSLSSDLLPITQADHSISSLKIDMDTKCSSFPSFPSNHIFAEWGFFRFFPAVSPSFTIPGDGFEGPPSATWLKKAMATEPRQGVPAVLQGHDKMLGLRQELFHWVPWRIIFKDCPCLFVFDVFNDVKGICWFM